MSLSTPNAAAVTASSTTSSNTPGSGHGSSTKSSLAPTAGTPSRRSNPPSAFSSAHPSPNGTLTRSPSLDAMTPRSVKRFDIEDHVASALDGSREREPADSPFFADWDRENSKSLETPRTGIAFAQDNDPFRSNDQKTYSLTSSAANSSTTPLYASATSPLSVSPLVGPPASKLSVLPSVLKLQVVTTPTSQGWPSPLSPLPLDAVAPTAPKLGTLTTPVMSPRSSLPTTPAGSYLRSASSLRQPELASTVPDDSRIHSLLDIQRKLPLPGQYEDEDITISSAMLSQAIRSDSVDSISSVLNNTGHDTSVSDASQAADTVSLRFYTGNAFLHEANAPPLHPLPTSVPVERGLPMPTTKHPLDPPLIPSLRRPDLMYLAGEASASQVRPVSPFSPTLPLYRENASPVSATGLDNRADTPNRERDLIDFESDTESALPDMYHQYARYGEPHSNSTYLANNYSTTSFGEQFGNEESASLSDEDCDEESYSSHALYNTLSTSDSPYVRQAWEGSRVVLVPSKHLLPNAFLDNAKQYNATTSLERPELWEKFTAVHALREETGSTDQYIGYGKTGDGMLVHARLDSENRQVQISLKQELDSAIVAGSPFDEFGMTVHPPASHALSRHTLSSNTASNQSSAIPPHLLVSSPATSVESFNFPNTPPTSSDVPLSMTSKVSSGPASVLCMPEVLAFPSVEQTQSYSKTPLSPTRRLNILHEKVIYRKRRIRAATSTSAPSGLASPPPMSRNDSLIANPATAAAAQVNSIQQATDRLSKLQTPSMQSINSLASVSTNNGKSVKKKDSKVRLRVPKWLGGRSRDSISGMKITESAPSTPIVPNQDSRQAPTQEDVQLVIEKVRVIQVDSYVVQWPGEESIVSPTRDFRRSLPLSARQSQQNLIARMHRKSSQPLSYASQASLQDVTVRQRRSFQHSTFPATLAQEPIDSTSITSARMSSRHNSNASNSSRISRRSSSALAMKHSSQCSSKTGAARDFSNDIAYLLDPSKYLEHFSGLFEQSLKLVIRSSREFANRFHYIRAREQEAVSRLRTEVLDQVWQYFAAEEAVHGLRHHLLDVFENVIMAFAHDYVYTKTISPSFTHEEKDFGNVINAYRMQNLQIADFGVSSGSYSETALTPVIDILGELCGSCARGQELWEKMPPQSYKRLVQLISETTDSASTVIALLEAKTPLDTTAHLRKAIDELVKATSSSESGHEEPYSRLATDDLIPLLSWALVKANAKNLPSLAFYAKSFRLSTHSQADSDWIIVQFEAAMAYLSTDPLRLLHSNAPISPANHSHSMSPVQPVFLRTVSEDSLDLPRRSRRSSIQSLPAEPVRAMSRSPHEQSHLASIHKRTLSGLPSTRMALYQAAGRPSSTVSAVTTEENEDNAEMGPPAPPRKDSMYGSTDGHEYLSGGAFTGGRERSTSPPIHRPMAVRPPRRPFHVSHDQLRGVSQHTRIPLARSQTTPLNNTIRPPSFPNQRVSVELSRTGSDGSRRGSLDWWGPLRYAIASGPASPPVGSEGTLSSRADSPASPAIKSMDRHGSARSSFDLERSSSDIGWMEWGRKRLSSMASSTSLVDSAEGGRSVAEQIAEKLAASAARAGSVPTANRTRRRSEPAAIALSLTQSDRGASDRRTTEVSEPPPVADPTTRSLSTVGSRPRSTLSLSSTSSLDTEASLTRSINNASVPLPARSQFRNSFAGPTNAYPSHSSNLSRSRRFRRELRSANLGTSMALPQLHLDTASASVSNNSIRPGNLHSHRSSSSVHLDAAPSLHAGAGWLYPPHALSHSTSRLGTTPFSPIEEVAPPPYGRPPSPEQAMNIKAIPTTSNSDDSVPPTPRDPALATNRPWSGPTP